jgi:hypothetical protein
LRCGVQGKLRNFQMLGVTNIDDDADLVGTYRSSPPLQVRLLSLHDCANVQSSALQFFLTNASQAV